MKNITIGLILITLHQIILNIPPFTINQTQKNKSSVTLRCTLAADLMNAHIQPGPIIPIRRIQEDQVVNIQINGHNTYVHPTKGNFNDIDATRVTIKHTPGSTTMIVNIPRKR